MKIKKTIPLVSANTDFDPKRFAEEAEQRPVVNNAPYEATPSKPNKPVPTSFLMSAFYQDILERMCVEGGNRVNVMKGAILALEKLTPEERAMLYIQVQKIDADQRSENSREKAKSTSFAMPDYYRDLVEKFTQECGKRVRVMKTGLIALNELSASDRAQVFMQAMKKMD